MGISTRRLTGVVMAFALSGSWTVLSACMAMCLQESSAVVAAHERVAPPGHVGHAPAPRSTGASGHAHHAAPVSPQPAMAADRASATTPDARLCGSCSECCSDGPLALVAGIGPARDAFARGSAQMASQVAVFVPTTSTPGASPPSPSVRPPLPVRAPLSLRI